MGLFDAFKKQFIDVIHWTDEGEGILSYRYPMIDMEIQNGGRLTVREGQMCIFVDEGTIADIFEPGSYVLDTKTLPVLTSLRNWDKLFQSPFKSDVFYFSTRDQLDLRWGTTNPITIRDKEFGHIRLRANGTYSYKITNPKRFFTRVSTTREVYTIADIDGQLRSTILTSMSSFFGSSKMSFLDMAGNQEKFSELLCEALKDDFEQYGLELLTFYVQNLSLPEELQKYLDKASSMNMIGDLQKYTQFQSADSISIAAANEGGVAGMGASMGAGMMIGQQMMGGMQGAQPQQQTPATQAPSSKESDEEILATIEKLHGLMKKGILSEEEFKEKKAELLSKLS